MDYLGRPSVPSCLSGLAPSLHVQPREDDQDEHGRHGQHARPRQESRRKDSHR